MALIYQHYKPYKHYKPYEYKSCIFWMIWLASLSFAGFARWETGPENPQGCGRCLFCCWMNFLGPEASGRSGRVDRSIVLRISFFSPAAIAPGLRYQSWICWAGIQCIPHTYHCFETVYGSIWQYITRFPLKGAPKMKEVLAKNVPYAREAPKINFDRVFHTKAKTRSKLILEAL